MAQDNFVEEQHDFSLMPGVPIFQLFRRTHAFLFIGLGR